MRRSQGSPFRQEMRLNVCVQHNIRQKVWTFILNIVYLYFYTVREKLLSLMCRRFHTTFKTHWYVKEFLWNTEITVHQTVDLCYLTPWSLLCPLSPLCVSFKIFHYIYMNFRVMQDEIQGAQDCLVSLLKMHFTWLFCLICMVPQRKMHQGNFFPLKLWVPDTANMWI